MRFGNDGAKYPKDELLKELHMADASIIETAELFSHGAPALQCENLNNVAIIDDAGAARPHSHWSSAVGRAINC